VSGASDGLNRKMPTDESELRAECNRLTKVLELAERDRQLLGYEIHDDVVQHLTAAAMQLEGAGRQATFASPDGEESYSGGLRLLQEGIAKARRLIRGAAGVEIDQRGLAAALLRLVDRFRSEQALPVTMTCDCADVALPASMQHLLLRIAQESLFNAWKHARASTVEVNLSTQDGKLTLTIADDGIGFDPAAVPPGHFGLEGIRARAAVLEAELVFDTAPHHGTRVVVRAPLPAV
jgi:signal transduction histidine kinase